MDMVIVVCLALAVGSFLNVCIYRLPKGASVVTPRSHCPRCKATIRWFDNIPLVSYFFLGGKCRRCKSAISPRYPIVEAVTALIAAVLYARFGLTPHFFAYAFMTAGLIVATFVDFEIQEIPDEVSIVGCIAGIAFAAVFPNIMGETAAWRAGFMSLAGAACGALSIYAMGFLGELVFRKEAMGGGDVKLMAMIGAFLGWKLVLITFFVAPVFGAVVGIVMKVRTGSETIPYGPYLSLGALVALFWGEKILRIFTYGML